LGIRNSNRRLRDFNRKEGLGAKNFNKAGGLGIRNVNREGGLGISNLKAGVWESGI
jgi:hypothetical protein